MRRFCDVCQRRFFIRKKATWHKHLRSVHHVDRIKLIAERQSLWESKYSTTDPVKITSGRETDLVVARQRNPNLIIIGTTEDIEGQTGTVGCKDDETLIIGGGCPYTYHQNWIGFKRWDIFADFTISVEVLSNCKTKCIDYTLSCVWHKLVWYDGSSILALSKRTQGRLSTITNKNATGFRDKRIAFAKLKLRDSLIRDGLNTEDDLPLDLMDQWKVPVEYLQMTVTEELEFIETLTEKEKGHYTPVLQHFCRFDCHPYNMRYCVNKTYRNQDDMEEGEREKINKSGALEFWRGGLNQNREREKNKRSGATLPAFYTCAPLDSLQSMQQWIVDTGYKIPLGYDPVGPLGLLEKESPPWYSGNDRPQSLKPSPTTFAKRILSQIEVHNPDVKTLDEIIEGVQELKNRRLEINISPN